MGSVLEEGNAVSKWVGVTQEQLDNSGRIHETAYIGSITALFILCWIAAFIRFYVRFYLQRMFSLDDVFLLIGMGCITTTVGMLWTIIEETYTASGYLSGGGLALALQPGYLDIVFQYMKDSNIILMVAWCAISCVKLSFLFLFRKLIDRLRYMIIYWWFVLLYVLAISGYGFAIYILVCPYFFDLRAVRCVSGEGLQRILAYSASQITLDAFGDLLILVIPIHIIWKVKVDKKQKFGLAMSLCLSVVMITVTICRGAGMRSEGGQFDSLWDGYWNIVSAEVGLIMTSATAFRALYIDRSNGSRGSYNRKSRPVVDKKAKLREWWHRRRSRYVSYDVEHAPAKNLSTGYTSSSYGRISRISSERRLSIPLSIYNPKSGDRKSRAPLNTMASIAEPDAAEVEKLLLGGSWEEQISRVHRMALMPGVQPARSKGSWHGTGRAVMENYPRE